MGINNNSGRTLDPSELIGRVYAAPTYVVPRIPGELHHERQQSKNRVMYIARYVIGAEDKRWRYDAKRQRMVPKYPKTPRD
ncbi:hypothetical protein [Dietzia sp. MNB45]|uniref:hypothetical protein n=1 Tax=Dietzia sp. MNB45 TaxID=3238800 RepID=UPI003F803360